MLKLYSVHKKNLVPYE